MAKTSSTGKYILIGVLAVIVVLFLWATTVYNNLVTSDETVNQKWADVQTQYQRRADLIPNLVATVQQYTDYEGPLLTEITQARSAWTNAQTPTEQQAAASGLDSAIGRLIVAVENYPNLKASEQFLSLQDELSGTENRVQYARSEFNAAVRHFNTIVRRFPGNILAGMFGFAVKEPFEAAQGSQDAPNVGTLFE